MFINYMLFLKMKAMAVISVTALIEPEMTVCRSAHSGIVFPSGTKHRNDVNVQCLCLIHRDLLILMVSSQLSPRRSK